MVDQQCFTQEWQARKRAELGGCDPVLLEKTIYAFTLMDALAVRGLQFVFKDGCDALLDAGRKQIVSHLVGANFRREEMKIAAAKAALLSSALRATAPPGFSALRYDHIKLANLKNAKFPAPYAAVGRLRVVPEAMWLWSEALRLRQETR